MPELLRFLLTHAVVGVAAGWSVLLALLATNVANLRTLIMTSSDGPLVIVMLAVFFALTFGSLGMGFGVMGRVYENAGRGAGGLKAEDDKPLPD